MIDEVTSQMRNRELDVGAYSSRSEVVERSTTNNAAFVVGTTKLNPTNGDVVGSGKPDPPTSRLSVLCASVLFHL